jgi:anti-sigma B factor antagonist
MPVLKPYEGRECVVAAPLDPASVLSIHDDGDGSRHTLRLAGELDLTSAEELHTVVSRLAPDATEIVLDMSELTFMDSTGVYLILSFRELCQRSRCHLVLTSLAPQVRRLFDLTGLIAPMREQGVLAE